MLKGAPESVSVRSSCPLSSRSRVSAAGKESFQNAVVPGVTRPLAGAAERWFVPFLLSGTREIGRTSSLYVGLGGPSRDGCMRNLARYQGLAGLARRCENARGGTAGRWKETAIGRGREGLEQTELEAQMWVGGLRWAR